MPSSAERDFVHAHLDDLHADLDAWLRIPSISADPIHAADVADSAAWLAEALRRTGFPTVEIWATPGAPAVFAEWPSADDGAPVALVYGHHDVQPVDPPELWVHPPFEPTRVDGPDGPELHARGAIDDKDNLTGALMALLERFSYALLEPIFPVRLGIRLLGVTLSSIDRDPPKQERQLTLAL